MTANGSSQTETEETTAVEPAVEDAPDGTSSTEAPTDSPDATERADHAGTDDTDSPAEPTDSEDADTGPTPQSDALRQQQYYVGIGGALLGGGALMTGVYQRFPDAPTVVPIVAGLLATALLIWLVRKSVFPGGEQTNQS